MPTLEEAWRSRIEEMLHDIHDVVMGAKSGPGLAEGHRDHERRLVAVETKTAKCSELEPRVESLEVAAAAKTEHQTWWGRLLADKAVWVIAAAISTLGSAVLLSHFIGHH